MTLTPIGNAFFPSKAIEAISGERRIKTGNLLILKTMTDPSVTIIKDVNVEVDWIAKCVVVGEYSVGKSSIIQRMVNKTFKANREPTIGIEFHVLKAKVGPTTYKLQLWDCAGQHRFRSIVKSYFRNSHVAFVVFDLNDPTSLDKVDDWVDSICEELPDCMFVLLGNKSDLSDTEVCRKRANDMVEKQRGKLLRDVLYWEVSAATGKAIDEVVQTVFSRLHADRLKGEVQLMGAQRNSNSTIRLDRSRRSRYLIPPPPGTCNGCM